MSVYPSLEDMKVDQLTRAQLAHLAEQQAAAAPTAPTPQPRPEASVAQNGSTPPPYSTLPYPVHPTQNKSAILYPNLNEYMGLEFTPEFMAANMPNVAASPLPSPQSPPPPPTATNQIAVQPSAQLAVGVNSGLVAPISGGSLGLHRAQVSHGIREVVVCKDAQGKIGIKVKDVSNGIFIILVQKNSPATMVGLRFGDQILQVNGVNVAGFNADKVHDVFKKASKNGIVVAVRDRPFERTITMHKGSAGQIGFLFKNGKIFSIVKDSSAARNGVLTDHQLLEVNGQNVVGLKDKDITQIVGQGGDVITITIMPSFIYDHIMKNIATSLVKDKMDHSI